MSSDGHFILDIIVQFEELLHEDMFLVSTVLGDFNDIDESIGFHRVENERIYVGVSVDEVQVGDPSNAVEISFSLRGPQSEQGISG